MVSRFLIYLSIVAIATSSAPIVEVETPSGADGLGPILIQIDGNRLVSWNPSRKQIAQIPGSFDQAAWANGGSRIALLRNRQLIIRQADGKESQVASEVVRFSWNSEGTALAHIDSAGTLKCITWGEETRQVKLADMVTGFSWSPDGRSVGYAQKDQTGGTVWAQRSSGGSARRLVGGRRAIDLAWSPDGRKVAILEPPLGGLSKLTEVTLRSQESKVLATVDAAKVEWSPDGARLLVRQNGLRKVVDTVTKISVALPPDIVGDPQWIGAKTMLLFRGGSFVEWTLNGKVAKQKVLFPLSKVLGRREHVTNWCMAPQLRITNEILKVLSPFSKLPVPQSGQLWLHGYLEAYDPYDFTGTIVVDGYTEPNGREVNLGTAITQDITFTDRTMRYLAEGSVPLRPNDLRTDDALRILVNGRLGSGPMEARLVALPASVIDPFPTGGKGPRLKNPNIEYDGVTREKITVPMVFPVVGKVSYQDWFLASRGGGKRRHHGQDLMADKHTPVVATFDGTVTLGTNRSTKHMWINLRGENGWTANYYHMNNDTPGSKNDGACNPDYTFAPGLRNGDRVYAGQFLGWLGNSGNAETTAPHLHFELWDRQYNCVINAYPSLRAAKILTTPRYIDSAPDLGVNSGERRIDLLVTRNDLSSNTWAGKVVARMSNGQSAKVETKTTYESYAYSPSTNVELKNGSSRKITPSSIPNGTLLHIITRRDGNQAIRAIVGSR